MEQFTKSPIEDLIQNKSAQEKGVLIFNELKQGFLNFQTILSKIKYENLETLPEFKFNELVRRVSPIFQGVATIQSMAKNPSQPDEQQKQRIIQDFTRDVNVGNPNATGFFLREQDPIWNIIVQSIALLHEETKTDKEFQRIKKKLLGTEKDAEDIKAKLDLILTSAQTELSKSGVEHHADIFKNQAGIHKENAKRWYSRAVLLLITTLLLALMFFFIIAFKIDPATSPENTKKLVETSVLAALIISFSTYAFTLSLKNYFAEKHNESINQHKANCLSTFNTFIDSADDDRKSAILLQATQTIFSHQSSGFLSKENDIQNPNPIVEIIKNMSNK